MKYLYNTLVPNNIQLAIARSQMKSKSKIHWVLKVTGICLLVILTVYAIYKYFSPDYDMDFDDCDFESEDDFEDSEE